MKAFELTLIHRNNSNTGFKPAFSDKIEADNLVELLTKLMFSITRLQDQMHDEELAKMRGVDDDIPF